MVDRGHLLLGAAAAAGAVVLTAALAGGSRNLPPKGQVQHVLFLMQENHSYDNFFGTYPGGNGFPGGRPPQNPNRGGKLLTGKANTSTLMPADLPHGAGSAITDYDNGRMDGFAVEGEQTALDYFDDTTIPTYWALADQYALHDDFYQSFMGPSLPNHLYWVSGSNGYDVPGWKTPVFDNARQSYPPYTWPTVFDQLDAASVPWHFYGDVLDADITTGSTYWTTLPLFQSFQSAPSRLTANTSYYPDFFTDLSAGVFAPVTFMVPDFQYSAHPGTSTDEDGRPGPHPPGDLADAQAWVQQVIDAVVSAGYWNNTLILLTWDEWGGYYDHVRPTFRDSQGPGFRVPLLAISPWSKAGQIVHGPAAEFCSMVKMVEDLYGLPYLTDRVRRAGDLWGMFDWRQSNPPPTWPTPTASAVARRAEARYVAPSSYAGF